MLKVSKGALHIGHPTPQPCTHPMMQKWASDPTPLGGHQWVASTILGKREDQNAENVAFGMDGNDGMWQLGWKIWSFQ